MALAAILEVNKNTAAAAIRVRWFDHGINSLRSTTLAFCSADLDQHCSINEQGGLTNSLQLLVSLHTGASDP